MITRVFVILLILSNQCWLYKIIKILINCYLFNDYVIYEPYIHYILSGIVGIKDYLDYLPFSYYIIALYINKLILYMHML